MGGLDVEREDHGHAVRERIELEAARHASADGEIE
jgi:hypothetical protein